MDLSPQAQIKKIIEEAKEILLIAGGKDNFDSFASLLALHCFLQKLGKKNLAVMRTNSHLTDYSFLLDSEEIQKDLKGAKDFIISLNISKTKVEQFKYDIKDDKLNIYITPRDGSFEPHDVETKKGKSKYDLIIVLNTPSLEKLESIYTDNAEIFYESPLVNIDYHSNNENFGEINLVESIASGTSEIIFSLLKDWNQKLIDQKIATHLLTGILAATNSFQSPNTTPRALQAGAELISAGANHNLIIQNLYKTHPLSVIRLWGRALARVKTALEQKVLWSILVPVDFEKSQAILKDIVNVFQELKRVSRKAEITFLLASDKGGVTHLKIHRSKPDLNLKLIKDNLIQQGFELKNESSDCLAFIKKAAEPADLEKLILEEIKKLYSKTNFILVEK